MFELGTGSIMSNWWPWSLPKGRVDNVQTGMLNYGFLRVAMVTVSDSGGCLLPVARERGLEREGEGVVSQWQQPACIARAHTSRWHRFLGKTKYTGIVYTLSDIECVSDMCEEKCGPNNLEAEAEETPRKPNRKAGRGTAVELHINAFICESLERLSPSICHYQCSKQQPQQQHSVDDIITSHL